jgi:hypothetical protein
MVAAEPSDWYDCAAREIDSWVEEHDGVLEASLAARTRARPAAAWPPLRKYAAAPLPGTFLRHSR